MARAATGWVMAAASTTARWPRCSPPFTVGLGFTQGFLPDFEPQPHDMPLDAILNENGAVWPV
jgi:5-formyltetrahydrofolate cyclo-ligase